MSDPLADPIEVTYRYGEVAPYERPYVALHLPLYAEADEPTDECPALKAVHAVVLCSCGWEAPRGIACAWGFESVFRFMKARHALHVRDTRGVLLN